MTSGTVLGLHRRGGRGGSRSERSRGVRGSGAERGRSGEICTRLRPPKRRRPWLNRPKTATGVKASPVAKRVAADKGISLASVSGSGPGGRITKDDVLAADGGQTRAAAKRRCPATWRTMPSLTVRRLASENNILLSEVAQGRPLSSLTRYDVMSAVASREAGKPVTIEPQFLPPDGLGRRRLPRRLRCRLRPRRRSGAPAHSPHSAECRRRGRRVGQAHAHATAHCAQHGGQRVHRAACDYHVGCEHVRRTGAPQGAQGGV